MIDATLTFEQVREAIHSADTRYQDHRVTWDRIVAEPGVLRAGEQSFRLNSDSLRRVCQRVGAPSSYLSTLPDDLWPILVNHHIRERDEDRQVTSVITSGDRLVGLGRADLARLSGEEVLDAVRVGSGRRETELEVANLHLDDDEFVFDVISPSGASEITPGDVIQAGVHVRHSPTGHFATTVEAYALRLVCRNGLTHRECLGSRRTPRTRRPPAGHSEATELQREQIRRLTSDSWSRIEQQLHNLGETTTQRADFEQMTAMWLRRARLSVSTYTPHLQRAWQQEGGDSTVYGVMNAFTRAANFPELPQRVRTVFSRLGGLLAFQSRHLCPRCFALVADSN